MAAPLRLRIIYHDKNGFNGRNYPPLDTDLGTVVSAYKMKSYVSETGDPTVYSEGRVAPRIRDDDDFDVCWTCRTSDGRTVELMSHEVELLPDLPFQVGDTVSVLRAARLPREESMGVGVITAITQGTGETLYWVVGFPTGRPANVLRKVPAEQRNLRGKCFSRSGWWQTLCGLDAANQGFGWTDETVEVQCSDCLQKIREGVHITRPASQVLFARKKP